MGLETGSFIEDLVSTNPLGTDAKSVGDNHIRLVKSILKSQFPNLGSAAVNATAAQLNDITDNNRQVPTGVIVMFSGTIASIPTGWSICDGTGVTPNLVDRFIIGSKTDSGATHDIGDTGGNFDIVITDVTDSHILTIPEIPAHTHTVPKGGDLNSTFNLVAPAPTVVPGTISTSSTGGGGGHTHNLTVTETDANKPPFFALAFIIKD